jgi:hypothetical protein
MQISRELLDVQCRPGFGTANTERMQLAFWEWMIRGSLCPVADVRVAKLLCLLLTSCVIDCTQPLLFHATVPEL